MLNYGRNKEVEKRPEKEPKFSMSNETDKTIIRLIVIGLIVVGALVAFFICAYVFRWF